MSIEVVPWISPSSLNCFSDCRQKWKWEYVDGYQSMGRTPHFDLGSGIHEALDTLYRDDGDPIEAFEGWVDEEVDKTKRYMEVDEDIARALQSDLDSLEETRKLGKRMLEEYVKWFSGDSFNVLAVEETVERDIPGTDWKLKVIIDAVVQDFAKNGRVYVLEHKTFKRFEEWWLYKDQQFVAEAWAGQTLVDEPVSGVIYNGLRKNPDSTRQLFERRYIPVNNTQIKFLLKRARGMHRALQGKVAIYPEPGVFKCRYCQFKEPCDMLLKGDDYQEYLDLMYTSRAQRFADDL